jgi:hypothetical protein
MHELVDNIEKDADGWFKAWPGMWWIARDFRENYYLKSLAILLRNL